MTSVAAGAELRTVATVASSMSIPASQSGAGSRLATPRSPLAAAASGAAAAGRVVSGRSSFAIIIPGRSGASPARTAACSYPSEAAAARTLPMVSVGSTYTRIEGQATAVASGRSASATASAGSTSASMASRSTASSASARRHVAASTPGGVQAGGASMTTTTRRVTGQSSCTGVPCAAATPSR